MVQRLSPTLSESGERRALSLFLSCVEAMESVKLCVGRSDAVAAGWGSFAIDRRAFFTHWITLSGPERPTLPEGIGLYNIILYPPFGRVERQRGEGCC